MSVTFGDAERTARLYRRLVLLVGVEYFLPSLLVLFIVVGLESDSAWGTLVAFFAFACLIGVFVTIVVTSYRLMKHIGSSAAVPWTIGMFLPLLNLLVLLGISSEATAWCKRYGIGVGFFGPTKKGLQRLRNSDG